MRIMVKVTSWRAICAVLVVPLAPVLLAVALANSGHSIVDYPRLIASGELSLLTQSMGWVGIILWAATYLPVALRALSQPYVLASTDRFLVAGSGETIPLDDIVSISVRQGFVHRVLCVATSDGATTDINVSYAQGGLNRVRSAVEDDPRLARFLA